MESVVKLKVDAAEPPELPDWPVVPSAHSAGAFPVIDLSSSGSDSETENEKRTRASDGVGIATKKRKTDAKMLVSLPPGFLDPLPSLGEKLRISSLQQAAVTGLPALHHRSRQFWKAGDFEGILVVDDSAPFSLGMDHVRVHPKFLHSNATSHKWVLGAFAELLDNSLDEVCNGATFVSIDVSENKKDGTKMLHIEDDGGGMTPDKMRQCMSLGYSQKSKIANCIGQYGNGFKTSTMRLGADVIVFSRSHGEGKSPTKSIGMLSYTFLKNTGKEDIVVPMLDYEKRGQKWENMVSSSAVDWNKNVDIFVHWSPYSSEADLLQQFDLMPDHGTRIVIYNLWDDDLGRLELDFDTDKNDIKISGVNRDEKKIQMAKQFPNSKHFLTYRHSLRSYASILYLRLPDDFRIILRGKEIEHHNIVNDMMLKQEVTYRPNTVVDGVPKDPNMVAVVTVGFVKDAKNHIDVQGFNVYHKNRLIKPFWRVWNAAGSDGRGVIGVLEANFVEPAHDKQGFERTTVLSRLETRLIQMQKAYWSKNCHKVGYAPRRNINHSESIDNESSLEVHQLQLSEHPKRNAYSNRNSKDSYKYSGKLHRLSKKGKGISLTKSTKAGVSPSSKENGTKSNEKHGNSNGSPLGNRELSCESNENDSESENLRVEEDNLVSLVSKAFPTGKFCGKGRCSELLTTSPGSSKSTVGSIEGIATRSQAKAASAMVKENFPAPEVHQLKIKQLEDENNALKQSVKTIEESMLQELQKERSKNKSLVDELKENEKKLDEANKEQEALIDIFSEERNRRDEEEATLRKKLKDAQDEIHNLLNKLATAR